MPEDHILCPVQAFKWHLATVKPSCEQHGWLFLSLKPSFTKQIGANTVSACLTQVILLAYETAAEDDCPLLRVRAHEVHALSASWTHFTGISVSSILEACHWMSHNTYTFYLRDLSTVLDELSVLCPLGAR